MTKTNQWIFDPAEKDCPNCKKHTTTIFDTLHNQLKASPAWEDRRAYKWLIGEETYIELVRGGLPVGKDGEPVYLFGMEIRIVGGQGAKILRRADVL